MEIKSMMKVLDEIVNSPPLWEDPVRRICQGSRSLGTGSKKMPYTVKNEEAPCICRSAKNRSRSSMRSIHLALTINP